MIEYQTNFRRFFFLRVNRYYFVGPLVPSLLDFEWLYPWVSNLRWIHDHLCSFLTFRNDYVNLVIVSDISSQSFRQILTRVLYYEWVLSAWFINLFLVNQAIIQANWQLLAMHFVWITICLAEKNGRPRASCRCGSVAEYSLEKWTFADCLGSYPTAACPPLLAWGMPRRQCCTVCTPINGGNSRCRTRCDP